jgi:hypothetical protein
MVIMFGAWVNEAMAFADASITENIESWLSGQSAI